MCAACGKRGAEVRPDFDWGVKRRSDCLDVRHPYHLRVYRQGEVERKANIRDYQGSLRSGWNMSDRPFPVPPGVASAERALRIARISFLFALLAPAFGILAQLFR